jgi:hypothetical protein
MNELLLTAIRKKRRIHFVYHDKARVAEPQCYGISTAGKEVVRVFQVSGGSQQEPLFEVAKMEHLVLSNESFQQPGPNYKQGDSAMSVIFAEL